MMDHEVVYERNLTRSYMKISAVRCGELDEKILLKRKLKGLLAVELCFYDGHPWYWYNISGKQSLDTFCRLQTIGTDFVEKMIISICDEVEILEQNLLDQNCLVLDPEYIFVNNLNQEIIFTAYPGNKGKISDCLQELIEYLLTKIDHSDAEKVRMAYALYERSLDQAYSLADLRDTIVMEKGERETGDQGQTHIDLPEMTNRGRAQDPGENVRREKQDQRGNENHAGRNNKITAALCEFKRNLSEILMKKLAECREKGEIFLFQKKETVTRETGKVLKGKDVPQVSVVRPDDPGQTPQPEIHPTVCLASFQEHPKGMLLYEGGDKISDVLLGQEEKKVGKSENADVTIARETISWLHARINYEDGEYYLEDLNSTNGTFVNEEPLAYKERRQLKFDDIIRFADVRFRFI